MQIPSHRPKLVYYTVLALGMIGSVITFNTGHELLAAGIILAAVGLLILIKNKSDRPVFDERDIRLAEQSSHKALMWSGVALGVLMIGISIAMGTGHLGSYPDAVGPVYLTWGGILVLAVLFEAKNRLIGPGGC